MNGSSRHKIVIAGCGAAPWMTAAALARRLDLSTHGIVVLDSGDEAAEQPFGVGDCTHPAPADFDPALFPDEALAVAAGGGAWSFGIALSGWANPGATYFQPFGSVGADLGPVAFHHVLQRLRQEGVPSRLANYSLSALAAQAGRFQLPPSDPRSVLSTCSQAVHVDLEQLEALERAFSLHNGVEQAEGHLESVDINEAGSIAALQTSAGERIEGDLFIDCSGSDARLIEGMPGSHRESWARWMPCDQLMTSMVPISEPPLPYSHAEANTAGWVQYLPLQGRMVLNAVFNSQYSSDLQVLRQMEEFAGTGVEVHAVSLDVAFGRRLHPWLRNCVALGTAAALIDPIGISNLQLLRSGISRLAALLPGGADEAVMAAEFNRQTSAELCHARDFALMHYRLNGRDGEELWDAARKISIPASAGYKLQLYSNLGRVAMYDFEPLEEINWINLFDEHGVQPLQINPLAEGFGVDELKKHADRVRSVMMQAVGKIPPHSEFLSRVNAAFASSISKET